MMTHHTVRVNPLQSHTLAMQSALPAQTGTNLDISSIFSLMLPMMVMVMMMKVMGSVVGGSTKPVEVS